MVAFEVLTESLSIDIWWLTTARGNSYQPVLMVADRGIPKRAPDARYPNLVGRYPNTVGSTRTLSVHSRT